MFVANHGDLRELTAANKCKCVSQFSFHHIIANVSVYHSLVTASKYKIMVAMSRSTKSFILVRGRKCVATRHFLRMVQSIASAI